MSTSVPAILVFPTTPASMTVALLALLVIGSLAARNDIANARGLDKIVALAYLCFGLPLAVFGAEHLSNGNSMLNIVPRYMPGRLLWVYFVGFALIAASLSIATRIQVQWSGLLVGIMMFLFVAMIHLPGAMALRARIPTTIVFRELSFGAGGWVLAGIAMVENRRGPGKGLIAIGRVLIGITALFFGVQHFLHPLGMPGVPLAREMPSWVPGRTVIGEVTGAFLLLAGGCFLLGRKVRMAATYCSAWIVLLLLAIYLPVLVGALADPEIGAKIEGLNYFADTLLFGGAILAVARAMAPISRPSKSKK